jgi:hypothetical protein
MSMFPLVRFDPLDIERANVGLREWGHKMGPLNRPFQSLDLAHGLFHGDELVGVATTSTLITANIGGGLGHINRHNARELSRLCAAQSGLNRVVLRLWREFVFPGLGVPIVISYQDSDLHTGNTYRFDGWEKIGFCRAGGDDPRSGRKARNRNVWAWPVGVSEQLRAQTGCDHGL